MNRRQFLTGTGLLAGAGATMRADRAFAQQPASAPAAGGAGGWTPLFNGRNLDGWYTFLQRSGKNNDPSGCVRVDNGMLRILGNAVPEANVEAGYLATNTEYSNYRLRLEYKWGATRFAPRLDWKRDNGLLIHVVGPDRVWPTCMEMQIQETDVGDAIPLGGVRYVSADVVNGLSPWPNPPKANPTGPGQAPALSMGGPGQRRVMPKRGDFEDRNGWNSVEVIVRGDNAAFLVNGRIVNSVFAMQRPDPPMQAPQGGTPAPPIPDNTKLVTLDRGKIALEIEYAETFFRNIEIRPLHDKD
jgi:hypothetical protein